MVWLLILYEGVSVRPTSEFNFTSPDVFHNYQKIYTFVQHIYNLLQIIHRLWILCKRL